MRSRKVAQATSLTLVYTGGHHRDADEQRPVCGCSVPAALAAILVRRLLHLQLQVQS